MKHLTARDAITTFAIVLIPIIALLLAGLFLTGCEYAKPACKIVSVVNQACMLVEYLGEDGQLHTVAVSPQELQGFAQTVAARQNDAGIDAGTK